MQQSIDNIVSDDVVEDITYIPSKKTYLDNSIIYVFKVSQLSFISIYLIFYLGAGKHC